MRAALVVVATSLLASAGLVAPCGKEPKPIEPEASTTTTATATATATPSASGPEPIYGPVVFHPQSCPPPSDGGTKPLIHDTPEGCKNCKTGEYCQIFHSHGQAFGNCRKSDCQKDADCKGALCACGPPNLCVAGNCRSSDDCGGRECAPDRWRYGHGHGQFCRTKDDTCKAHQDCGPGRECAYIGGKWDCRKEVPPPPPG